MNEQEATRRRWDDHYREAAGLPPKEVITDNLHLLPPEGGLGLELACGLAANAFTLARHGIEMEAWDISPVAIEKVNARAAAQKLPVRGEARDVVEHPPEAGRYDLVVVTHFLDRTLVPHILAALKPGGLLFYQTYTRTRVSEGGPGKDEWRLADNELLTLFGPMRILYYRENGLVGDTEKGLRSQAAMVAQKPG